MVQCRSRPRFSAAVHRWQLVDDALLRLRKKGSTIRHITLSGTPNNQELARDFHGFVETRFRATYRFAFCICVVHADAAELTKSVFSEARAAQTVPNAELDRRWMLAALYRNGQPAEACTNPPATNGEAVLIDSDKAHRCDEATIRSVVHAMPARLRLVLSLFYFEQLGHRDIARILALPPMVAISTLAEAKMLLRQRLLDENTPNIPYVDETEGGPGG